MTLETVAQTNPADERPGRGSGPDRPSGRASQPRRREAGSRRQPIAEPASFDWKDVRTLRAFLDDSGRIKPRRKTRLSAKAQRALARAVKRARYMALLPYTPEHIRTARPADW